MDKEITELVYACLFQSEHYAIAILDKDFNFLRVNERFATLGNKHAEDYVGKNYFTFFPASNVLKIFQNVVKTKRPYYAKAHLCSQIAAWKNQEMYCDWTLVPILDEKQEIQALFFGIYDVTDQVQAKRLAVKTETYLKHIIESFTDPFLTVDKNWKCTYINQQAVRLTHYRNAETIIGKSFWDFMPHVEEEKLARYYTLAMEKKKAVNFLFFSRYCRKWFSASIYPFPEGLVIFYRDITDRKTAELKLRESQDRFRKIFEADPVMKGIISIDKNKIIAVNDAWLKTLGYARAEVVGKQFDAFAGGEKTSAFLADLCRNPQQIAGRKIKLKTKAGEPRYCLLYTELIKLNQENCLLCTIVDRTEQYHMEAEIAWLERLNLVGQMAGGLGHEIRNPMTAVHGFLQLLSRKPEYQQDKEYFEIMFSELERANTIISEFLVLSKREVKPRVKSNLAAVVRNLAPLIEATALRQNKNVIFQLSELPDVYINEKEIKQVILNLVQNGLDVAKQVTLKTYCENDMVVLDIIDDGPGIAKHVLDRLGTPFLTTKENGTGLGLPISFSIVRRHGGQIAIKTSEQGTTFSVKLPAIVKDQAVQAQLCNHSTV